MLANPPIAARHGLRGRQLAGAMRGNDRGGGFRHPRLRLQTTSVGGWGKHAVSAVRKRQDWTEVRHE